MIPRWLSVAIVVGVVLIGVQLSAQSAMAVYEEDQGQSTRSFDQEVIFCYSDWIASVTQPDDKTSATYSAQRTSQCLFGAQAHVWFQFELTHTPPNGGTYLMWHHDKNPYTSPGCYAVTYCEMTEAGTTTQPGFYQLTSWANFHASLEGTPWQWPVKAIGWTVKGPPGPFGAQN
ncbi:MAG TPA: hypothetical protein VJN70_21100 [Gemmatimonadaceae bacterium]|nr:hypothetical protein [Gemmatimonadaceae bacterium]